MKKVLTILLALFMLLQLAACSQLSSLKSVELPPLPEITEKPEVRPMAESVTETPPMAQEPVFELPPTDDPSEDMHCAVIVNFRSTLLEDYDPAEGTEKILRFSYVTPHVTIPGREDAADAINEKIAMLDETYYTGNDYGDGPSDGYNGFLEQAIDNFTYAREMGVDIPLEFEAERTVDVERADGRILSLYFNEYSFLGGAHGSYVGKAYVFDTKTGTLLTLQDLTPDYEAFSSFVAQKMVEQAQNDEDMREEISPFIPEEDWERSFARLLREGSWYLDDEGLVLFSQLYELASYAAGIQSFTVSYEDLGSLLFDKWRPGVKETAGSFELLELGQMEEGSFPILDMVQLSENGEQLCLRSGECVYDVVLSRADYSEDLNRFFLEGTLWYCSCMQNSGVQITAVLPETVPDLALSWRGEDGMRHTALLTRSGENGALILMEESLES